MDIAVIAKNAIRGVQHRSPAILTGFAVAGLVSTAALTAKAAVKANNILDDYVYANGEDVNPDLRPQGLEAFKLTWSLYLPPFVTGLSTAACIIGAQSINARRQAALVGAFTITESAFQEYKDKVIETLGPNKEKKVRDEVIQKHVTDNPPPPELLIVGGGNVLCLDNYTGRYFESTMEKIRGAQNDFNQGLLNGEMYLSLNEFYHFLTLPDTVVGEQVGFSSENLLDIQFSTSITPDGRPCLAISFRALPRQDYFRFQ